MSKTAANAACWTDYAIATLAFARTQGDVDGWAADNGRYLGKLKADWPAEHRRIHDAVTGRGWALNDESSARGAVRAPGAEDSACRPPRPVKAHP